MNLVKKIVAYGYTGDFGLYIDKMTLELTNEVAVLIENETNLKELFSMENNFNDLSGRKLSEGVVKVEKIDNKVVLYIDPFIYRYDFTLCMCVGNQTESYGKSDISESLVKQSDDFEYCNENGVLYRLYKPETVGPRPLILFLHGGGESGRDNMVQLTGTLGAFRLAERFSDMYIMAPQAPDGGTSFQETFEIMKKRGDLYKVEMGMTPFSLKGERGWNRDYLSKVCANIRRMIGEGMVDPKRVYIIGLSMGGGGVLSTLSVDPTLFAAAVPICPSMNGESYGNLLHLPEVPVWIMTAFIDSHKERHAYILQACQKLWAEERKDVKFTLFMEDELKAYGIGLHPDMPVKDLLTEYHNSWILVFHNEHGVLDWMVSHINKNV